MESKPYLENTPENGHHQWGYSNKLSPNKIDLSQCTLKEDCPMALKAMYEFIGVAITAASGTYHPVFKNFDDIDESYDFEREFVHDKRYADKTSRAMFAAVGQKLALRFKEKDFSDPIQAPEATQVIETFRLHDNGWHILQSFFETLHPKCGAQLDDFDPHKDLATLKVLPNETMSQFLLRCTNIRNKFTMTKGETPYVRIMDRVVNCLYRAPGLSTALSMLMTTITQHKITHGMDNNAFQFELEDVMVILKSHQIKLSHNLNPSSERANIASFIETEPDEEGIATINAFNGKRPKCEICFRPHSVKYCPYRGKEFWPPSIMKRANQYNLKHNEFKPSVPPRDPKPYPQSVSQEKKTTSYKKPFMGKEDKAKICNLITEYLQENSTKEVSDEDVVQINSLATKYLGHSDTSEHPISLLASLECQIPPLENGIELNANIATIDSVDKTLDYERTMVNTEEKFSKVANMSTYEKKNHEDHINSVTEEFNRFEPVKYNMFQPTINFVSEFQSDEENISYSDNQSENTMYMDTVEDVHQEENSNLLSNTEEMYILFCSEERQESSINNFDGIQANDKDEHKLDPFIASGEAPNSDEIIDLVASDNEEELDQKPYSSHARENEKSHPLDVLLEIDANDYDENDERFLKLMSLAIQNGAPPNLVTLYLNGHLQKSHIINFIKTTIKSRKPISIDISTVDFSLGHTQSNPIDLISPLSVDSKQSSKPDNDFPEIASATGVTNVLPGEPASNLRDDGCDKNMNFTEGNEEEFAPPTMNKGKLDLKTFQDYNE